MSGTAEPLLDPALMERVVWLRAVTTALDPGELDVAEPLGEIERRLSTPLAETALQATTVLEDLEASCEARAASAPGANDLLQALADVCFVARGELGRALRALDRAPRTSEGLLVACESLRRKARRALWEVLEHAEHLGGPPVDRAERAAELEAALAVRALYARFREALPGEPVATPVEVSRALNAAAFALASTVRAPDFAEVRLADRRLLVSLQARVFVWIREQGDVREGQRLFQDVRAAAELLRSINQRQELVEHDRALAKECLALLEGPLALHEFRGLLRRLSALRGRDDALDALLDAARRQCPADLPARLAVALRALFGVRNELPEDLSDHGAQQEAARPAIDPGRRGTALA